MKARMKPQIWLIVLMLLMLGATLTTENTETTEILVIDLSKRLPENPYQEEYERMLYPTVRIKAGLSTGSGVVIDDYILTAAHVVGNQSEVTVEIFSHQDILRLLDRRELQPSIPGSNSLRSNCRSTKTPSSSCLSAFVAMTDTIKDLAIIKPSKPLPYSARLAPKDYTPYIFSPVWTVGCSLGLPPRPSYGHLCVLCDSVAGNWEISAPILPGNSGGPVYDAKTYEVIGIAVWVHTYKNQLVTTMGGVVPINQIYEFLDSHKGTKTQR
jgi:S1-C subfamily serine protease